MSGKLSTWQVLAFRSLLLNPQDKVEVSSSKPFVFNTEYPNPTFLVHGPIRTIRRLLTLQEQGYLEITDIKLDPGYLNFYRNNQSEKLKKAAARLNYGLSKVVLAKVRAGAVLTTAELGNILQLNTDQEIRDRKELLETLPDTGWERTVDNYQLKYYLNFPVVIAKYISLFLKTNQEKLNFTLNNYITELTNNKLHKEGKNYFSYVQQKKMLLNMLAEIAVKQDLPNLGWTVGAWYGGYGLRDELIDIVWRKYNSFYNSWVSEDGQYYWEPYGTLMALENEGKLKILGIETQIKERPFKNGGLLRLGEGSQVITTISIVILDREALSEFSKDSAENPKSDQLVFDVAHRRFTYKGKIFQFRKNERTKSMNLNLCLLLYNQPLTYSDDPDEPLTIQSELHGYIPGDAVHVDIITELLITRGDKGYGRLKDADGSTIRKFNSKCYRKIRDAVRHINTRAKSKLGITIFKYEDQDVYLAHPPPDE